MAAALAASALEARLAPRAATWIENALQMRREAGGGAGPDATLSEWYQILARARSLLGETDAAVQAASAAVVAWGRTNDQQSQALVTLKEVLAQAKDLDAWVVRYDAEVATSGVDAPVLRKALGALFLERGRNAPAAVQLRAARELDPLDAETHGMLVRALDASGDAAGALEALLASVRMAPKNLDAYPDLAQRFFRAGDAAQAERAKTSLVEAVPSEPDGYRALAKIREANGKWALAARLWGRVTDVRPKEPEGWLELGRTETEAGDKVAARAALQHVLDGTWDERFGDVKAEAAKRLERTR